MIMSQAEYTMDVYVTDGATGTEISNIIVNKTKMMQVRQQLVK